MGWILRRLRRRGGGPELTCYLRENGPIAYELRLFGAEPRPQLEALLETGFVWFWRRSDERSPVTPVDWTQVTRWSMAALRTDLGSPGAAGAVMLLGFQTADMPNDLSDDRVIASLRAFLTGRDGILQVVVQRRVPAAEPGGRPRPVEDVFVAQQPPEPVRVLLQAWGIDPIKAERRAYARLHGVSLEDWMQVLLRR